MNQLFSRITLIEVHRDVIRNIVSLIESQDLFDDLSDKPEEWFLAQQVEEATRPSFYQSRMPVIHRPFEDAKWSNAIVWPFNNWQVSRFSDGSFGIWYGSDSVETTVFESVCHWYSGLLRDAGFEKEEAVISERKLYSVTCDAGLLDFCPVIEAYPDLVHKTDYTFTQSVGARIHHEGHPGLLTASARYQNGENYVVFNTEVLSNPRHHSYLIYRLEKQHIFVEKKHGSGSTWLKMSIDEI